MIQPLGYRVLVLPDAAKDQLKTDRIAIPDAVLDRQRVEVTTGNVVGIGKQAWKDLADGEAWAKIGDHIVYAKHGGKLIKDPETDVEYVLLNDKDVIGLL